MRCRNVPLIPAVSPAAVALPYLEESFASECDFDVFLTLRLLGEALPDLRALLPVSHPGLAALGCVELGAQLAARIVNTLSALLGAALRVRCAYVSGVAVAVDVVGTFRARSVASAVAAAVALGVVGAPAERRSGRASGRVSVAGAVTAMHRVLKSPSFAQKLYAALEVDIVESSAPVVYALRRTVAPAALGAVAAAPSAAAPFAALPPASAPPSLPSAATKALAAAPLPAKGRAAADAPPEAWRPEIGSFVFCRNSKWIELISNPDRPQFWVARVLRTLAQRGIAQLQWFRETGIQSYSYQQTSRTFVERASDLHPVRGMRLDVVLNLWMCSADAFRTRGEIAAEDDLGVAPLKDESGVTTNVDGTAVVPVAGAGGSATVSRSAAAAMQTTSVHAAEIAALRSQVRVLLFPVTFYANHAHNLTRSP